MSFLRLLHTSPRRISEIQIVLVLLAVTWGLNCATSDRPQLIHAEIVDRQQGRSFSGDMAYFFVIEYREPGDAGALSRFRVQVSTREWMMFRDSVEVCIERAMDGIRLRSCGPR